MGEVEETQQRAFERDWRDRAEWWLDAWARWASCDAAEIEREVGYRKSSAGFSSGGLSGEDAFDHLVEWADSRCVMIMDAAVAQLSGQHYAVIHNRWLGSVWTHRGDPEEVLAEALRLVWKFASERGVV